MRVKLNSYQLPKLIDLCFYIEHGVRKKFKSSLY